MSSSYLSRCYVALSAFIRNNAPIWLADYLLGNSDVHEIFNMHRDLPCMFWTEKALILLDYLQIYSIIWNCANPYPWPYLWIGWTRGIGYANIDLFSMTPTGALGGMTSNIDISRWGTVSGYGPYAMGFASVGFLLALVYVGADYLDSYGKRWDLYQPYIKSIAMFLGYIMYLPINLAVFRLFSCESNGLVTVDYTMQCFDSSHVTFIVIGVLFVAPLFLTLPVLCYRCTQASIIYSNSADHEKFIQASEIAYMLELNNNYLHSYLWVAAPFTLSGAHFRTHMLLLKALVLCFYAFVRIDLSVQAALIWLVVMVFSLYYIFCVRPYRITSSNIILVLSLIALAFNTSFAAINAFGVSNAVTVASVESIWLLAVNVVIFAAILLVAFLQTINPLALYPPLRTLQFIRHNQVLCPASLRWIETLRSSNAVKFDFMHTPVEIADVNALEEIIRDLRDCWRQATTLGSIFSNLLSDELEETILIHTSLAGFALRKKPFWDEAYQETVQSGAFRKRNNLYRLMSDKKRRILFKIFSLRTFAEKWQKKREATELATLTQDALDEVTAIKHEHEHAHLKVHIRDLEASSEQEIYRVNKALDNNDYDLSQLQRDINQFERLVGEWEEILRMVQDRERQQQTADDDIFNDNNMESWYVFYRTAEGYLQRLRDLADEEMVVTSNIERDLAGSSSRGLLGGKADEESVHPYSNDDDIESASLLLKDQ